MLIAMLRLGRKYHIAYLGEEALAVFRKEYPTSVDKWEPKRSIDAEDLAAVVGRLKDCRGSNLASKARWKRALRVRSSSEILSSSDV